MRIFLNILFVLYGVFGSINAQYRDNTILFCLKPEQNPLEINQKNGVILTGIEKLDLFIKSNNIVNIQPWLSSTNNFEPEIIAWAIMTICFCPPLKWENGFDSILSIESSSNNS